MKEYIKSLTKMKTNKSDLVAFVSHGMDLDGVTPKPVFNIKALNELTGPYYGLEMMPMTEALAIKIVMTWKMRHYLYELLTDMINGLTFFGWEQEGLAKEKKKLEKLMKENKEHPEDLVSWDEVKDELGVDESEFDHFDHEEYMLMWKVLKYQGKLHEHSVKRETGKVKKSTGRKWDNQKFANFEQTNYFEQTFKSSQRNVKKLMNGETIETNMSAKSIMQAVRIALNYYGWQNRFVIVLK